MFKLRFPVARRSHFSTTNFRRLLHFLRALSKLFKHKLYLSIINYTIYFLVYFINPELFGNIQAKTNVLPFSLQSEMQDTPKIILLIAFLLINS